MARITVFAHRFEVWIRVIRPNVCGLHSCIAILAIGHCVSWKPLHPCHLPHSTSGIFDKVELWFQLLYQIQDMLIYLVTELCVIAHRIKIACFKVFASVMTNCRNAECGAIRACPNHIRLSEPFKNVFCCDCQNVGIKIDAFKVS